MALPALRLHHHQPRVQLRFGVEQDCQFACCHAMHQRDVVTGHDFLFYHRGRTFDAVAANGVHAVQHDELLARFRSRLEAVFHRGHVGVEAAAHVLDVEHQRIQALHLFLARGGAVTMQAEHGQAAFLVLVIVDLVLIQHAPDAVLGTEEGTQLHVW